MNLLDMAIEKLELAKARIENPFLSFSSYRPENINDILGGAKELINEFLVQYRVEALIKAEVEKRLADE